MDRNQDGHVTPTELQFMLRNLGIHVRDDLIDDLMKDASHEGKINYFLILNFFMFMWNVNALWYIKYILDKNHVWEEIYTRHICCVFINSYDFYTLTYIFYSKRLL